MKTLLHFLGWVTVVGFLVWSGLVITGISVFQTYTIGMNIFSITTILWVFSGLLWGVIFDIYNDRKYKS